MGRREHSYNSGRINRAGKSSGQAHPAQGRGEKPARDTGGARVKSARPRGKRRWPWIVVAVVVVLAFVAGGIMWYINNVVDPGNTGTIIDNNHLAKNYTKKKDVTNFLLVGIDYEQARADNYTGGLGLTDMLIYVNFDHVNNKMSMLQIPRDSYVGEMAATGGSGKINALLANGPDKENPINNLAKVIEEQYKLPVDHYISIDMDGLVSIVDALGSVTVYIPQEMYFDGSYLSAGEVHLNGAAAQFFVRNRSGEGFGRGDPDRLDNQRRFYAGLFKRLKNMSAGDLVNLLPVVEKHINTDFSAADLLDLAQKLRAIESENILFCMAPGATSVDGVWSADPVGTRSVYATDWNGRQIWQPSDDPENAEGGAMVSDPDNPGLTGILNEYFRAHGDPVPVEQLGPQDPEDPGHQREIPENVALYPPNIQVMSALDAEATG